MTAATTAVDRDTVLAAAAVVADDAAGRADAHDRDGTFAGENVEALWAAGLGNLTLPAAFGGPGVDLVTTAEAVRLVAAGDASTALVWVMHLLHLQLFAAPSSPLAPAVRDRVFASSLAGPALINALRVEPELGTPARGGVPSTRAERRNGPDGELGWRISGHKIYATGSVGLRWMLVWAATADDDPDGVRIGPFLVPADAPGIEVRETWDHLGMRATVSHDVVFDRTPIPLAYAGDLQSLGSPDAGLRDPAVLGAMVVLLLSVYAGPASAARDWLTGYLHERIPSSLGAPLATLPRFQAGVGEIEARLHVADRLVSGLAADLDAGGARAEAAGGKAALVKVAVTRQLIEAVQIAVELVGNPGLSHHHPLQRHLRDVLCSRIHTPQDDTVLTAAGRSALARQGG